MASHSNQPNQQEQLTKKEEASSNTGDNQSPGHAPPALGYPPSMGYPPGQQPGYPPPYPGYNQYHQYPYTQPPPAAYYNSPAAFHYQQRPKSSIVARTIFSAFILVAIVMCISSIVMWMILRPEIPEFRVENLTISNFNVTKPGFTSIWEVGMTVVNPNEKLKVYFDRIESFMYYDDDELLATSVVEPFSMKTGENIKTQVKLSTNNTGDQPVVGLSMIDDMAEERKSGFMSFDLRFIVWSTFKSGSWWSRHSRMRVSCEDLKVVFDGITGNAKLLDGKGRDCIV